MGLRWIILLILAGCTVVSAAETRSKKVRKSYRGVDAAVVVPADSLAHYQELADQNREVGNRQRNSGKTWLGVGIGAAVVGGVVTLYGISQVAKHCEYETDSYGNETCTSHDPEDGVTLLTGYTVLLAGSACITVGIILKAVGGGKLRRAERYDEKVEYWRDQPQGVSALDVKVMPLVLPDSKAVGATLALGF